MLAEQTPASFIAFDLLALGDDDYTGRPFSERRAALVDALAGTAHARSRTTHGPSIHVTPATTDLITAQRWFEEFEGAGLDGVIAKPLTITYQPDKRVMFKIKHQRAADCVVAGYRVHKSGGDAIGSLLLGLYKNNGTLASVGVIGAFPMAERRRLFTQLQPVVTTFEAHPWNWAAYMAGDRTPRRNEGSRWNAGKDLSVRTAAARVGGRGPLRPHGGRTVPPHSTIQPLAPRPRPTLMHLRPARAPSHVQPRRHRSRTRPGWPARSSERPAVAGPTAESAVHRCGTARRPWRTAAASLPATLPRFPVCRTRWDRPGGNWCAASTPRLMVQYVSKTRSPSRR